MRDRMRTVLLDLSRGRVPDMPTAERLKCMTDLLQLGFINSRGDITPAGRDALDRSGRRWVSDTG